MVDRFVLRWNNRGNFLRFDVGHAIEMFARKFKIVIVEKRRFVRVLTKKWSKVGSVIEVLSQSGSSSLFMRELYTENS